MSLDVSQLETGVYFVQVLDGEITYSQKLVVE
jgi:hypothetical protein